MRAGLIDAAMGNVAFREWFRGSSIIENGLVSTTRLEMDISAASCEDYHSLIINN
jgi:hypothetical protein